jgi:hypothetical protein
LFALMMHEMMMMSMQRMMMMMITAMLHDARARSSALKLRNGSAAVCVS